MDIEVVDTKIILEVEYLTHIQTLDIISKIHFYPRILIAKNMILLIRVNLDNHLYF